MVSGHALTELIIFSLELLRPRIHAIPPEARRNIGQCILTPLIDKTPFDRVLDIVIRVVDIMVRNGDEVRLSCPERFLQFHFSKSSNLLSEIVVISGYSNFKRKPEISLCEQLYNK